MTAISRKRMKFTSCCVSVALSVLLGTFRSDAIIFLETADSQHNVSTPGDNSGWQYEGHFHWFLGVPISPYHFITAQHIEGPQLNQIPVGTPLILHGDSYATIAVHHHPSVDLSIWEIDHSKPFPSYAPLSSGAADISATAVIFGRGTLRGDAFSVNGEQKGWKWGASSSTKRWGRNVVNGMVTDSTYGNLLYCDFDKPGIPGECHLSTGDSGGGMFVLENGLWRLAGVNFSVDGPFRETPLGPNIFAAAYDAGGLYIEGPAATWNQITDTPADKPSAFYSTRISSYRTWIQGITGLDPSQLASESFADWKHWYFTPTQISNSEVSGPLADFDGDGLVTLIEFALNLDPTFNERATMISGTGLRGLPLVRVESGAGGDHLTIEFVRRTAAGGSGVTCIPQFSDDLSDWQIGGTESVTPINSRWDRVKVTDTAVVSSVAKRFVRLKVVLD